MQTRVTIIGLGCVGSSIGLALRRQSPSLEVMGHDKDPEIARRAAQKGAVTRIHWNLPAACERASLIVLALPLPAVRETMEALGPYLEEGCVVTDTAPLKVPVLQWASQYLPPRVHFITGFPIPGPKVDLRDPLQGPEAARADLFEGGFYCVTPAPDTASEAVSALLGLADVLKARPLFLDPVENDGLQAGAMGLPQLVALALLRTLVDAPGWADMRKIVGYDFASLTGPLQAGTASTWSAGALLNRENLIQRLDMFLEELHRLREWILEENREAVEKAYAQAAAWRNQWLQERAQGMPEVGERPAELPTMGEQMSQIFFGGLFRRRPPRKE
ncbi:MAG: prephenate dehydrogenase [Anaerolineae bacterium]|nr:prephenate dehydrogenase [Anaerolineae bacterium]MDW7992986.1 prephenate dehydrogenase [Anaerolineae bacterium]